MEFEKQFDWCIEWYDKETEFAVGYERSSGLSLNEAREIFGEKSAFIIDCYSIEHEHVSAIQPLSNTKSICRNTITRFSSSQRNVA